MHTIRIEVYMPHNSVQDIMELEDDPELKGIYLEYLGREGRFPVFEVKAIAPLLLYELGCKITERTCQYY